MNACSPIRRVARRLCRAARPRPSVQFGLSSVGDVLSAFARATPDPYFAQIGSNDGVTGGPIHAYVTGGMWRGLLVEPVPYLDARLLETYAGHPGLAFENVAIGADAGSRPIYRLKLIDRELPHWYEQLASFDYELLVRNASRIPALAHEDVAALVVTEYVRCTTVVDLFDAHGVRRLDLLRIDTEGYDYEILKQVDFERWRPRLVLFEHRHLGADRKASVRMLTDHGYEVLMWKQDAVGINGVIRSTSPLAIAWRRRK